MRLCAGSQSGSAHSTWLLHQRVVAMNSSATVTVLHFLLYSQTRAVPDASSYRPTLCVRPLWRSCD